MRQDRFSRNKLFEQHHIVLKIVRPNDRNLKQHGINRKKQALLPAEGLTGSDSSFFNNQEIDIAYFSRIRHAAIIVKFKIYTIQCILISRL
jgi:hypothetical protein